MGKGPTLRLFIREWMEARFMSDDDLGDELGVSRTTVFRWRTQQHRLNPDKIADIAAGIGILPEQLFRPPAEPIMVNGSERLVNATARQRGKDH